MNRRERTHRNALNTVCAKPGYAGSEAARVHSHRSLVNGLYTTIMATTTDQPVIAETVHNQSLLHSPSEKDKSEEKGRKFNVKDSGGRQGWRSRLRNRDFRRKVWRTVWLCFSFLALGVSNAQKGPAFLDLQLITNTNVQQASAFFTAGSAGFVTGSLLSGLVYDLLSKSLSLILGLVALAALTAATPFCRQFTAMVAVIVLGAIFEGGVDTAGNADVIRTWGSEGGMAMQAIHFSFALGGVVAPLVTEPFLAPRLETGGPNTSTDFATALSSTSQDRPSVSTTSPGLLPLTKDVVQMYGSNSSEFLYPNSSQNDPTPPSHIRRGTGSVTKHFNHTLTTDVPFSLFTNLTDRDEGHIQQTFMDVDVRPVNLVSEAKNNATFNVSATELTSSPLETQVHYAFIICALFTLFPAVPLLVGYASNKHQKKTDKTAKEKQKTDERKDRDAKLEDDSSSEDGLPRALFVVVLVWVCVFFMLYSAIEDTIANYLATFVVMQLDWSKSDGALLTSTFWGCFAASRFVCILVSRMVTTVQLLTTCCILMLLFFVGFLVASLLSLHWAVWTFTALIGASMSAIFPGAFSWMEVELMAVTGRITSVIMLAASLGLMISPLVLGHLMETRGAIWLAYILLGEALACLLTYLLLLLFSRTQLRPRYGRRRHQHHVTYIQESDRTQADTFL